MTTLSPPATAVSSEDSNLVLARKQEAVSPLRYTTKNEDVAQTVDDLVRLRALDFPDRTIVSYPSTGIEYVDYTMEQLDVYAFRVARHYEPFIPVRTSSSEKPMVVALLGPSNLEYLVTMLALAKLAHTVLFLSTRISQEAIESLMTATGARKLLVDRKLLEKASAVQRNLADVDLYEIPSRSVFEFSVEAHGDTRLDVSLDHGIEASHFSFIIHSSGSTGLPKPIYQTQKAALANYASSMEMKAFITLPLYHNHGICNFFRAVYSGKPIHLYNADLPLTSTYLTRVLRQHDFEIFYGVPYALKLLAETNDGVELLRKLKVVMYGGSACPDELGDVLVGRGVNLISHYGATEVGQLMTSFRPPGDNAWNYVRENDRLSPYLKWIPRGPNLFECCVLAGWSAKVASNQPDGSYTTKDLFEPHPTIPRAWKYIARLDDTIVLVNGEKFNPVQMEGRIRSDGGVTEAVVFGSGRPYLGLLVVPSAPTSKLSREETLLLVWAAVEAANKSVEAYARISRDMVKLLPHDAQFPRTDKGSVIRQAFYKAYAEEIDAAYDIADSNGDRRVMGREELEKFLASTVTEMMSKSDAVRADADFFSLGMDSLQAIQLRSEILRNVDISGCSLGQNVVFDYPSVEKLAAYLLSLTIGGQSAAVYVEDEMQTLIEKYSVSITKPASKRSSVVVTGATGCLGAHLVSQLSSDESIHHIYCLVRAKTPQQALERVRDSLVQRKIYHTLPLSSQLKLVALPFNQSDKKLGLPDDTYQAIAHDLRAVIHCAWSVNFNLRLSSFEHDCIAGVHNLLQLCLAAEQVHHTAASGPATFNFCSSVSTVANCPLPLVPEALPDLNWAQRMGYAQSKLVAEQICDRAAREAGVPTRVLRIGQIVGDTRHGVWNAGEAVPLMLRAAVTMGALPRLRETPAWLPVDVVARAVQEIALAPGGSEAEAVFANVVNRRTFNWADDLLPALQRVGLPDFDIVEPREWIRRLRASNPDPVANPSVKLVEFWAGKYDRDAGEGGATSRKYTTDVACGMSSALREAPVLDQEFVKKFMGYFMREAWKTPQMDEKQGKEFCRAEVLGRRVMVVLTGRGGVDKVAVGKALAASIDESRGEVSFMDADAQRPQGSGGEDHLEWLEGLKRRVLETFQVSKAANFILVCSRLAREERNSLRELADSIDGLRVVFVALQMQGNVPGAKGKKGSLNSDATGSSGTSDQVYEHQAIEWDEIDVFPVNGGGAEDLDRILGEVRWAVAKTLGTGRN